MEQVRGLMARRSGCRPRPASLARALRSPNVRGRWGEMQLKRVVELAGMVQHCDFEQQVTLVGEDGGLRPDLVVRLPGGRQVVVDAKVPLEGYLQAMEAKTEDERARPHARARGPGARAPARLGSKAYWAELAGDAGVRGHVPARRGHLRGALEETPALMEEGWRAGCCWPRRPRSSRSCRPCTTAGGRRRLAENAEKISEQGRLLHERVATLLEHWTRLGGALGKATEHFNAAAASFEGRVLPAARRLEEMGAGSKKAVAELPRLDARPRLWRSRRWRRRRETSARTRPVRRAGGL
jgi:DNA recombination protein RmuC